MNGKIFLISKHTQILKWREQKNEYYMTTTQQK